jgi:VanZ family protein
MIENERILKITKKRISFFLIFVLMFVVTEIGRRVYRPYIYANDIFDFWIADTIGNLTGTITVVFFDFAIINPTHNAGRIFLAVITIGLIVYEFVQYFSPRSVLDWRDIIATLIGGVISLGIYELLCRQHKEEIS